MTLITDIVRCSVQFETAADMRKFVSNWILKYGVARRNTIKVGWMTTAKNETREFFRIFGEYFRNTKQTVPNAGDDAANNFSSQASFDDNLKLFEIFRIRNRLDPNLVDAPGGYRDLAFKLKIGFVRCGLKYVKYFAWMF